MNLKLTSVAIAVSVFAGSVQAQVFINKETDAKNTYLYAIGAPQAWARGITGKGSVIAVIDNGFATSHTDLKTNVLEFKNFYIGTSQTWGLHGTQMASIAAGVANGTGTEGVAPDAKLLLAQAGSGGTSTGISMSAVLSAMTWADSKGANVINLSLGSTYDSNFKSQTVQIAPGIYKAPATYGSMYGNKTADLMAFANASKNAVIVASAGNSATGYAQFPGAFATQTDANGNLLLGGRVLIVGNVKQDASKNWVMDPSSNQAGSICTNLVGNTCNDKYYVKDFYVVAPGSAIWGAVPDQARTAAAIAAGSTNGVGGVSGTSPSAALVSGGIALMHQAWPQLKASQLVEVVLNTATSLGDSNVYGKGMVNFDKATQPYADVKYTKAALTSGPAVSGTSLTTTSFSSTSGALSTSSVLKNVQVVDSLNRNFTADFTRAIGTSNPVNSLYTSPYLAMQSVGYREFATPFNKDSVLTFMQSQTGFALQYETAYKGGKVSYQMGSMSEQNGFLNNYGSGLMALGNSSTTYAMVGGSVPVADKVDLIGSYGVGVTRTNNVQDSMLAVSPTMISDTWKIGFAKKDIFFSGKTQDQLTFAVHGPVAIRKGYADVTAVNSYTYTDNTDGTATANPVSNTERVNLASGMRQTDLILGYSVNIGTSTYAGVSIAKQFNVGGIAGQTSNAVGAVVRSVF